MNQKSRTQNVMLNIVFGYVAQVGIFVLSFIGRRIFLNYLSPDYLGINGLYSNILTLLSLAELGLDTAVVYSLYKPVADNDTILIRSLLRFYKKVYFGLAGVILIIGLALIPFLGNIVKSTLDGHELVIYYIVFLGNTVASYFVAHKSALLSACQEQRVQKMVSLSATFLLQIVYIIVLIVTHSYMTYVISMFCVTIISNWILSITCSRIHTEIFAEKEIVTFEKKPIIERVISTFLYKMGAVLVNSTDNILISVLVNTTAVGFYSNYYTVINAVQGFIAILTTSLVSSIGNYAATNKKNRQKGLFFLLLLFYHTIAAIGLIGFSLLLNDVITIWLGSQYLFDTGTVFVISFNFYISTAISPVWMFREANGLFNKVKYILLIRALINIVLSILWGRLYGVCGIFMATAVSLLVTNFWYEPQILFKEVMNEKTIIYWVKQIKYFMTTMVAYTISYFIVSQCKGGILFLILKILIIFTVTVCLFFVTNLHTIEVKKGVEIIKGKFR